MPDSGIICGAPIASSWTIKFPLCGVLSVGSKVTETLQVFPGANALMHWVLTANGAEVVSPVIVTVIFELFELAFLIFTFLGLLILSTLVVLPKFSDLGENVSLPAPGVGVAVGVQLV